MTRIARIHRPPRSAMQAGQAATGQWVLDFPPTSQKRLDPLTGWWGSDDTQGTEVSLRFSTLEDARAYAAAQGIAYEVEPVTPDKPIKPKIYADNFKFGRLTNWTH